MTWGCFLEGFVSDYISMDFPDISFPQGRLRWDIT